MDRAETRQLLDMLAEFYPRPAKERRSTKQELAWAFALAPYDYGAVKAAALQHVRSSSFFPDVSELTAGLGGAPAMTAGKSNHCPYSSSQLERVYAGMDEMLEHGRKLEAQT